MFIKLKKIHVTRKQYFITLGVLLGLVLVWAGYILTLPKDQPIFKKTATNINLTLKPQSMNNFGMQKDSTILISSKTNIDLNKIKDSLTVEPKIGYTLAKKSSTEALITFNSTLKENRVYQFTLAKTDGIDREYSWAYQVRAPFQVISSIPANEATSVKKNSVIEFTTNRENFKDVKNFITIEPKITFDVEQNGKLIIVKPNQSQMENAKIYKVTLLKGLNVTETGETLAEDKIIQFATEATTTNSSNNFDFNKSFYETNVSQKAIFEVNGTATSDPVKLSLYKFTDPKIFATAYSAISQRISWVYYIKVDQAELAKYSSYKISDLTLPLIEKGYNKYVELPEALPNAYYIIVGQSGNAIDCAAFQSTKTSSFLSYSPTKSLVWVNDLVTQKPIAKAAVSILGGDKIGETDDKGAWFGETPDQIKTTFTSVSTGTSGQYFVVDSKETVPVLIPIEDADGYVSGIESEKYQSFVSLDKPIYKKTDKVNFWGVAKKRDGSKLNNITIKISENNYTPWGSTQAPALYEKDLAIGEYGTFGSNIDIEDLAPGTYSLTVNDGDIQFDSAIIEVATYVKPAYKLSLTQDKEAIYSGEEVQFKLKAEFFDGSPVANTEFNYKGSSYNANSFDGKVKSDAFGAASFKLNPAFTDKNNYPHSYDITVTPTNSEESDITESTSVRVFQSSIILSGNIEKNVLKVNTNNVILDGVNYIGTPAKDQNVTGTITWQEDVKTEAGEVFNPISKLMEKKYNSTVVPHKIKDFAVKTGNDGKASYNLDDLEKNKNYEIYITTADSKSRAIETRTYYRGGNTTDYTEDFLVLENLDSLDSTKTYKVGETAKLRLKKNSETLPANSNYLFFNAQNGLKDFKITTTADYERTFQIDDIPNLSTMGVWFDGKNLYQSNSLYTNFDKDQRKLAVKIQTDKTKYLPGDTAKIDVTVNDINGKGKQSEVNMAVIDDALNAINKDAQINQSGTILGSIYSSVNGNFLTRASHKDTSNDGGKGGGGGDGLRSDIIDVAYYGTITTDSSGKGHIEFKLPDNITSFKMTTYAISKDLEVGEDLSQLVVTKPLFVDATLNENYLSGDEVTLRLRAFGESNANTEFTAKIKDLNIDKTGLKADASGNVYIALGKLPLGTHEVIVGAKNGSNQDSLLKKINVLDSYYNVLNETYYSLANNLSNIKSSDSGRTNLVFTDENRGEALSFLYDLYYQFGERSDQIVTRNIASDILKSSFGQKNISPNVSISNYQFENGGIALLPYGTDELELSAKLSDLGADVIKNNLINYFTSSLIDTKADADRRAIALYGLASLGQPYLAKLQAMKTDALSLDQSAYVAMGLIKLGDIEGALDLYQSKILPGLIKSGIYYKAKGDNETQQIKTSANIAIVATVINSDEAAGLRRFVRNYNPTDDLVVIQKAILARDLVAKPSGEVSFSYNISGKETTKTINPSEIFELSLTKKEAQAIKFSNIKGQIGLVSAYSVSAKPAADKLNPSLSLTRSYQKNGKNVTSFNEGDVVDVVLTPKIPGKDGSIYIIEDYLPSGLKLAAGLQDFSKDNTTTRPNQVDGQKIEFMIFNDATDKPIRYKARIVSKGIYKADPATLMSGKNSADLTITGENSITIK